MYLSNSPAGSAASSDRLVDYLAGFRPAQLERLRDLSTLTGVPVRELVRRAVDSYLRSADGLLDKLLAAAQRDPEFLSRLAPTDMAVIALTLQGTL
ncbi:MAG: ribbon-helix-helix domain-containing protein [Pseudomonadota bacterium]